ncbi:dynein light arm chain, putative [Bodo saltans]|uniref:Dynein light chain n=1 Tax=Bodo saltans TaxID=75058 RepID=A0A0S4JHJ3_BODSA|nr:dynein light arm chain, putative [Bodo saltans]|eukprot:CUG89588.1 dynein light arm chain, putative [Bodo saltans]
MSAATVNAPTADGGTSEVEKRVASIIREVQYADLPDDQQKIIMDIASSAYEKFVLLPTQSTWRKEPGARKELEREVERSCLREIAQHIKATLDEKLGASWHVVFGRSFASFVTHERMSMIHFSFEGADVVVWKHGA